MYLGADNYLGATAYLGAGGDPDVPTVPLGTLAVTVGGITFATRALGDWCIQQRGLKGWFDGTPVRADAPARPGQHGQFGLPAKRDGRSIGLTVWCHTRNDAEVGAAVDAITGLLADGEYDTLTVTRPDGQVAHAVVRINGQPLVETYGWQTVSAQLELWSPEPYRYGSLRQYYTTLPEIVGGLRYPLFTDGTNTTTEYAWTGTANASASTEADNGVATRTNLFPNPSLELDVAGWSTGTTRTTVLAYVGSACANLGTTGTYATLSALAGATTYTVSAWVYIPSAVTGTVIPRLVGAVPAPTNGAAVVERDAWTRVVMTFTTIAAGGTVFFYPAFSGEGVRYADAVLLTQGGPEQHGTYFDGDTVDTVVWGGNRRLHYGPRGSNGRVTVTNDGNAPAWPIFEVRGPAPEGFTVKHVETGRRIVSTTAIPTGSSLVVDSATGTAVMDGTADRSGQLTVREWSPVPAGGSATYAFSAPVHSAAALVVGSRDTSW